MKLRSADNRPARGELLELEVESLAHGGRGVARVHGYVVFVEGAVPGDIAMVRITRAKSSYAEGRAEEILNPSGRRTEPRCRHFGHCGGCAWQTLDYEEQLRYKQQQLVDCLEHIGGLAGFEVDPAAGARPLWRYRNKVEFAFAGAGDDLALGFHPPGRWQEVVDIEDCLLHSELTNRLRLLVRESAAASGLPAYDQQQQRGFWRHLVLREGLNTGEVMVNVVTAPGEERPMRDLARAIAARFPKVRSLVWSINDTPAAVAGGLPYRVMAGRDHIFEEIEGIRLKVFPATFLQTNTATAARLYRLALEYARPCEDWFALDLYAGTGSIALLLARHCRRVLGIELVEEAVAAAAENAEANGIENTAFIAGKVRQVLGELPPKEQPQLVVLDPPRAGAGKKEIERLASLAPRRIVYVSCNAATMAGNARLLVEGGYRLERTVAVDMFPHTLHVESVSLFERG